MVALLLVAIAVLTGNAGDLLLALWRRVPIEVLTVHGNAPEAAAMIGLVALDQRGSS